MAIYHTTKGEGCVSYSFNPHGLVLPLIICWFWWQWIDKEGKTPLIAACMNPQLSNVAKTLIELGANVNAYRPGIFGTPANIYHIISMFEAYLDFLYVISHTSPKVNCT